MGRLMMWTCITVRVEEREGELKKRKSLDLRFFEDGIYGNDTYF